MPQTLLLADDSATIQRVIELTFATEDIQVISVSDGDQAIARLQSAPPDIVLADIGMPGKTGYEVAEYIKRTPQLAHIPVVLLTGAFEPVDQAKAAAVGCDGVLAKPFEPQIVIGRVRELLGRASASAAGSASATAEKKVADIFDFAPSNPEPATSNPEPETNPEPQVEDYFDRLDAAFKTLSPAAAAPLPDISLAPPPVVETPPQDFAIADAFAAEPARAPEPPPIKLAVFEPEPEPLPATEPEPEPIRVAPEPEPIRVARVEPEPKPEPIYTAPEPIYAAPEPRTSPPEPRTSNPEPRVLPSLPDAFSAILAAEQNVLGVKPEWPSPASESHAAPAAAAPAPPAELVITDDLIDRVARRVLEQMSDKVVRETVADIASQTAERLVREEIARIKASVK